MKQPVNQNEQIEILECTLRDASYPIAYQFTAEDTAVIAAGLEDAGFRLIEIGHGLGLGASTPKFGLAAATDEEYLAAAASVLKKSKFGVFMIPGIATREHLELVAKYKAGFIRVGTNVNQTEQAEEFIKFGKDHGMEVSANLMKTYASPLDEVVKRSEQLEKWGADVVAVIDSAGGMLPHEVSSYVRALKSALGVRVGFHGHNNMQLAVANSLAAIEAGASVVDGTLRGLGRSSGNAQTEAMVLALDRMGYKLGVDIYKTMDLADKVIGPLAQGRGSDSLELASGYALFHSSYMSLIDRVSKEAQVDPRELIIRVSAIDKVSVSESLAKKVAAAIKQEQSSRPRNQNPFNFTIDVKTELKQELKLGIGEQARQIAQEMNTIAKKTTRASVFTIALSPTPKGQGPAFPFVRWTATQVVGNAEVETAEQAKEIAGAIDGLVDCILVDDEHSKMLGTSIFKSLAPFVKQSQLLAYRDSVAHLDAAEAMISQLTSKHASASIGICGASSFGMKLAIRMLERGASVAIWDEDREKAKQCIAVLQQWLTMDGNLQAGAVSELKLEQAGSIDLLAGTTPRKASVGPQLLQVLKPNGVIVDVGVGSLTQAIVEQANLRGNKLYRLDMRAGLAGQISISLDTLDLVKRVMGESKIAGAEVVAGGLIGKRGTIVVDAVKQPTRIIGIADGKGSLLGKTEADAYSDVIHQVKANLVRSRLPHNQLR